MALLFTTTREEDDSADLRLLSLSLAAAKLSVMFSSKTSSSARGEVEDSARRRGDVVLEECLDVEEEDGEEEVGAGREADAEAEATGSDEDVEDRKWLSAVDDTAQS